TCLLFDRWSFHFQTSCAYLSHRTVGRCDAAKYSEGNGTSFTGKRTQNPTRSMKPTASRAVVTGLCGISKSRAREALCFSISAATVLAAKALNDHGLLVLAEDTAQGIGDFANRGVGFNGSKDSGKEIFRGGGSPREVPESHFRRREVTPGAQSV